MMTQPEGECVSLVNSLAMEDNVRRLMNRYEATNEVVIALLAGKTVCLDGKNSKWLQMPDL